jgi:drug/metabolite transporter (DMT)-like permease
MSRFLSQFKWHAILITAMMLWSVNFAVYKHLLGDYAPETVVLYRFLFGTLVMGLLWVGMDRRPVKLSPAEWLLIGVASIVGILVAWLLLMYTVQFSGSSIASILKYNPLFVAIIAVMLKMEKMTTVKFAGVVLGIVGVGFVVFKNGAVVPELAQTQNLGMVLGILASCAAGVHTIIGKKIMPKLGGLNYTFLTFVPGAALITLWYGITDRSLFVIQDAAGWLGMGYVGIFGTAIVWWLFAAALRHEEPGVAASYKLLIPLFTVILSFFLFGEQMSARIYVGMILIAVGVYVVTNYQKLSILRKK